MLNLTWADADGKVMTSALAMQLSPVLTVVMLALAGRVRADHVESEELATVEAKTAAD